jgi:small subunit ribosomal protein S17
MLLTKLKLNHAVSPLDNPLKIRQENNIARLKTELSKRQIKLKNQKVNFDKMEKRNLRKERIGVVVSNKMDKSYYCCNRKKHPKYKSLSTKLKLYAHDEKMNVSIGDTVKIMETRP